MKRGGNQPSLCSKIIDIPQILRFLKAIREATEELSQSGSLMGGADWSACHGEDCCGSARGRPACPLCRQSRRQVGRLQSLRRLITLCQTTSDHTCDTVSLPHHVRCGTDARTRTLLVWPLTDLRRQEDGPVRSLLRDFSGGTALGVVIIEARSRAVSLRARLLRLAPQEVKRLGSGQRRRFADFDKGFELRAFFVG